MGSKLHIDGHALQSGAAGLWRLLIDHTGSERATADLLVQLAAARRGGAIEYCLVLEEPAGRCEWETGDRASWRLCVVRPAVPPGTRGAGAGGTAGADGRGRGHGRVEAPTLRVR